MNEIIFEFLVLGLFMVIILGINFILHKNKTLKIGVLITLALSFGYFIQLKIKIFQTLAIIGLIIFIISIFILNKSYSFDSKTKKDLKYGFLSNFIYIIVIFLFIYFIFNLTLYETLILSLIVALLFYLFQKKDNITTDSTFVTVFNLFLLIFILEFISNLFSLEFKLGYIEAQPFFVRMALSLGFGLIAGIIFARHFSKAKKFSVPFFFLSNIIVYMVSFFLIGINFMTLFAYNIIFFIFYDYDSVLTKKHLRVQPKKIVDEFNRVFDYIYLIVLFVFFFAVGGLLKSTMAESYEIFIFKMIALFAGIILSMIIVRYILDRTGYLEDKNYAHGLILTNSIPILGLIMFSFYGKFYNNIIIVSAALFACNVLILIASNITSKTKKLKP